MAHVAIIVCVGVLALSVAGRCAAREPSPPEVFTQAHHEHSRVTYTNPVALRDGTLARYGVDRDTNKLHSQTSHDGGRTWGEDHVECDVFPGMLSGIPLLAHDGEIHITALALRGKGRQIAVDRFIDVWHLRTTAERTRRGSPTSSTRGAAVPSSTSNS